MESFAEVIGEEHFPQLDGIFKGELPLVACEKPSIGEEEVERVRLFCFEEFSQR